MAKQKLDKLIRKALLNARNMIEDVAKADGNEAETRRRVERIFESLMGYNVLQHISREYAIQGAGNTEHCDFAIQLGDKEKSVPALLVELKRVNIDLTPRHLKQAASYAIDLGCEWVLLTNSKDWKLYHILFDKPPQTKLVDSWNLMTDELQILSEKFALIGYKNMKKNGLAQLWEKSNVLTTNNMLKIILSEDSISSVRRGLRRMTDVTVTPEEIVGAVRHMLNEAAATEMGKIKITLPGTKLRVRKTVSQRSNDKKGPVT